MSESNNIVEDINNFLVSRGYSSDSDINRFTSEQWFDFAQIAMNEYQDIALSYLLRQLGIETAIRTSMIR